MKIGFDAKRAASNFTGLGNYSRTLIHNLQCFFPEHSYFLYTPRVRNLALSSILQAKNTFLRMPKAWAAKQMGRVWRSLGSSSFRKDGIELYHGLSGELPLFLNKNIRAVVTVHDLIFMRFPSFYKPLDRFLYKKKLAFACKRADLILAVSEQSRQDLIRYMNIDGNKIQVVYQTCDASFRVDESKDRHIQVRKKYQLPPSYLLNVGTLEERKNALVILKALQSLPSEVHLVLVGKPTAYAKRLEDFISKHHLEDRVMIRSDISFEDLPAVYQMATLFVYPSLFEGFGIPILEALFAGVPVISSTGSCFAEAGGPSSIYIDADDSSSLAEKINFLLKNEEERKRMIRNGRTFAQNFLPHKLSEQLMQVYQDLVQK